MQCFATENQIKLTYLDETKEMALNTQIFHRGKTKAQAESWLAQPKQARGTNPPMS